MITKEDKKERRVLTVSEAELFLGEAQKSFYYNLFVLALETGMRIGELCGIQWQDIDFEKKVQNSEIQLQGKVPLEEYKNLVFVTKNNRPTQQFIIQECIKLIVGHIQAEYPEFEKITPHCFRHTFATRANENGMQPKSLQKLLGHGSLQITMDLYCHVTDDTLFQEMQLMEMKCAS